MSEDVRPKLRKIPSLTGVAPPLGEFEDLPDEPVAMFLEWLNQAVDAGVPEPHTTTLSTVDAEGTPDARVLILKDVDDSGWAFASLASSQKGQQLNSCPAAAMTFWWPLAARSVRVRGEVVEAFREESEADLRARSPAGQRGVDPDDWTLWRIKPSRVEFWQGSTDRHHTRIIYIRSNDGWRLETP